MTSWKDWVPRVRSKYAPRVVAALLAFAIGCGNSAPASTQEPELDWQEAAEELERTEAPPIVRTRESVVQRAALHQMIDQGLGKFLSQIEVEPFLPNGAFAGWTVVRYDNEWIDLLPGDVVTLVNDQQIRTPAQTQKVWLGLKNQREIRIQVRRGNEEFELRFTVSNHGDQ